MVWLIEVSPGDAPVVDPCAVPAWSGAAAAGGDAGTGGVDGAGAVTAGLAGAGEAWGVVAGAAGVDAAGVSVDCAEVGALLEKVAKTAATAKTVQRIG